MDHERPAGLLTKAETANRYKVTPTTLDNWHKAGIGPRRLHLTDRCVRYREDDVQAFIEARTNHGAA